MNKTLISLCVASALAVSSSAFAKNDDDGDNHQKGDSVCKSDSLPSYDALKAALIAATGAPPAGNGGFNLQMWATVVDRTGAVCRVTFSGAKLGDQWPGSRVISAQKANTANEFSLPGLAVSTANLYTAVQPGGSLFGLQESNPVDVDVAYRGPASKWGKGNDPMRGDRIGGVNVFGGGLALYDATGKLIGGLGVSGDSSCADHNIAWKLRHALNLDSVPFGVSATGDDNIIYDQTSGFAHPECAAAATTVGNALPTDFPIGPAQ